MCLCVRVGGGGGRGGREERGREGRETVQQTSGDGDIRKEMCELPVGSVCG